MQGAAIVASAAPSAVTIVIPGKPVAWQRTNSRGGIRFTPVPSRSYQSLVKLAAQAEMAGRLPMDGPVAMTMRVLLPIPPSWSRKKQAAALTGEIMPTGKPDVDNALKQVADACNGIVYRDDAQIVSATVEKRYYTKPQVVATFATVPEARGRVAA